jgi:hypothetical protein
VGLNSSLLLERSRPDKVRQSSAQPEAANKERKEGYKLLTSRRLRLDKIPQVCDSCLAQSAVGLKLQLLSNDIQEEVCLSI